VGVAVKHRQLVHQVGVFTASPLENLMASLSCTSTMLDEGTTFIFSSWICVANGLGGFNSHLVDSRNSDLDELLLPNLVWQVEKISVFNAISTHAAPELVGSDSNRSEGTTQSKSLSDLEEDLDLLLKLKNVGATTCWGASIFENYSDSNEEYSPISTIPSS
jgi:hypothetical protein